MTVAELSLFDMGEPDDACRYPQLSPLSGYKYGCRCSRCKGGKAAWHRSYPNRTCPTEECSSPITTKGARWCDGCLAQRMRCGWDGCGNQKRPGSGSRYCEEHALCSRGELVRPQVRRYDCAQCGEPVYGNSSRPPWHGLCASCREPVLGLIRSCRKHGVPRSVLLEWMERGMTCHLCGTGLRLRNQGYGFAIDHDHAHCAGGYGCAECVRGVLCTRCNTTLGSAESLLNEVGVDALRGYSDGLMRLLTPTILDTDMSS